MDDLLILAVGRAHIETAANLEKMIALVKQKEAEIVELKKQLAAKG